MVVVGWGEVSYTLAIWCQKTRHGDFEEACSTWTKHTSVEMMEKDCKDRESVNARG